VVNAVPPPDEIRVPFWWNLRYPNRPDEAPRTAVKAWRGLAKAAREVAEGIVTAGRPVKGPEWSGEAKDLYFQRRYRLLQYFDQFEQAAESLGYLLDELVCALDNAKHGLDRSWRIARSAAPDPALEFPVDQPPHVRFRPPTDVAAAIVWEQAREAERIRRDYFAFVLTTADILKSKVRDFDTVWGYGGLSPPDEVTSGPAMLEVDGRIIVNTGSGSKADIVGVGRDWSTGRQTLVIRTEGGGSQVQREFPADAEFVIRTGGGDDMVIPSDGKLTTLVTGFGRDEVRLPLNGDLVNARDVEAADKGPWKVQSARDGDLMWVSPRQKNERKQ
jgi:hypothetical protein